MNFKTNTYECQICWKSHDRIFDRPLSIDLFSRTFFNSLNYTKYFNFKILALKYINKYSINIPLWNENHVDGSGDFLHTNFGWCFEICLNFCECWESAEQPSAAQLGIKPKHSPHSPSREFQLIACHVLPSTTRNSNLVDTNFGGRNKARNSGCVFFYQPNNTNFQV